MKERDLHSQTQKSEVLALGQAKKIKLKLLFHSDPPPGPEPVCLGRYARYASRRSFNASREAAPTNIFMCYSTSLA
jgi:hypothetical protein